MQSTTQKCSTCRCYRPIEDFLVNKHGTPRKTCSKHSKKRTLPQVDQWDDFIYEIRTWNKPSQCNDLDITYIFDLDQLPVTFNYQLEGPQDSFDRTELNSAISSLVRIIWQSGGFRFRLRRTDDFAFTYNCSQDISLYNDNISSSKRRDRCGMQRFACSSKLKLQLNTVDRRLSLYMHHKHHNPYIDIHLSEEVLDFINERSSFQTPSEIYHNLQTSGINQVGSATPYQIYYRWHQENKKYWRRDNDQFVSATRLLDESANNYSYQTFSSVGICALGIYIEASISSLAQQTKELVIDATYGTNNAGMELYSVLAELDGTGVPLAYMFVEKCGSTGSNRPMEDGAMTHVLDQFLRPLFLAGFTPSFFGCDKDKSEINAIKKVWPSVKIQLCFWHAKRAIKAKMRVINKADSLKFYQPCEAVNLIPSLEICWGSYQTNRSDEDHRLGRCQCESRNTLFSECIQQEISSSNERDEVLGIFSRHYNAHSKIPDQSGNLRSPEVIHRDCADEMYLWCHAKNYFKLWAYLYTNWYKIGQWEMWARSNNPNEIPVLKTTMILESHWRRIKCDFLHRFNRPRIDLVIWVLTTRSIPQGIDRMMAIQAGNRRKAVASWRKAFKNEWKQCQNQETSSTKILDHHTNAAAWVCGCKKFLLSRFLLCKHIISCYEKVRDPTTFFARIHRQRISPFWTDSQLILRPEFQTLISPSVQADESTSGNSSDSSDSEVSEDLSEEDPSELEDESIPRNNYAQFRACMHRMIELCDQQEARGNTNFIRRVIASNVRNQTLVEEIERRINSRTMPRTWTPNNHPATMYYQ